MKAKYKTFNKYLYVILSGNITKNIPELIKPESLKNECIKKKLKKIFINGYNLSGNFTTIERFNYAKNFSYFFAGSNIKISIVSNKNIISPKTFFETVAVNRGVNIKVFVDLKEAKKWLLK